MKNDETQKVKKETNKTTSPQNKKEASKTKKQASKKDENSKIITIIAKYNGQDRNNRFVSFDFDNKKIKEYLNGELKTTITFKEIKRIELSPKETKLNGLYFEIVSKETIMNSIIVSYMPYKSEVVEKTLEELSRITGVKIKRKKSPLVWLLLNVVIPAVVSYLIATVIPFFDTMVHLGVIVGVLIWFLIKIVWFLVGGITKKDVVEGIIGVDEKTLKDKKFKKCVVIIGLVVALLIAFGVFLSNKIEEESRNEKINDFYDQYTATSDDYKDGSNSNSGGFVGSDGEYHNYVPEFGDDVNDWMAENW